MANLSVIPLTGIDRNLFAKWCELDKYGGKSCVDALINRGWIQNNNNQLSLHFIVAEVVSFENVISLCETMLRNGVIYVNERDSCNVDKASVAKLLFLISNRLVKLSKTIKPTKQEAMLKKAKRSSY